jgi:hypothetical protein
MEIVGMTAWAAPEEERDFLDRLGPDAVWVCDLDGTLFVAYDLAGNLTLPLSLSDDPKAQSIPFGTSPERIAEMVSNGVLVEKLFARLPMDVRLPPELAARVNDDIENGRASIVGLTSRAGDAALKILKESGVTHPERMILVADSGGTIYAPEGKTTTRALSAEERAFLDRIEPLAQGRLGECVQDILRRHGCAAEDCPDLSVEKKGIACNIHYRAVLEHYGLRENSGADKEIGSYLKKEMTGLIAAESPLDEKDQLVFKTLDGPATVEVKIAAVNKGIGFEAVIKRILRTGRRPAFVFCGDDLTSRGKPGTDWFAAVRKRELAEKYGVSVLNVHVHHPEDGPDGARPDPDKGVDRLGAEYEHPEIDLRVPTARALCGLILRDPALKPSPAPQQTFSLPRPEMA